MCCCGLCAVETHPARTAGANRAAMRAVLRRNARGDERAGIVDTHRFFVLGIKAKRRNRYLWLRATGWLDREFPMAKIWRRFRVASGIHFVANMWHVNGRTRKVVPLLCGHAFVGEISVRGYRADALRLGDTVSPAGEISAPSSPAMMGQSGRLSPRQCSARCRKLSAMD